MSFEKPTCLALILCDYIIEDKLTGNKSLIGLFSHILTNQLPCVHNRMCVVVSLSNGRGEIPIKLSITSLSNSEKIFEATGKVAFNDPLAVCDLVFDLRQVPFKTEGTYVIAVSYESTQLLERRFTVKVVK